MNFELCFQFLNFIYLLGLFFFTEMEPIWEQYTPCIGILVVDVPPPLMERYGTQWYSYISAGLSKWLESAGAFTVPIWIGRDRAYYQRMMRLVNGILLPGGPLRRDELELTNDYIESAYHIFDLAMEMNRVGKYFPLWGTCLGFQLLLMHAAKDTDIRTPCSVSIQSTQSLQLTADFRESKILKELPKNLEDGMKQFSYSCHNYKFFVSKDTFDSLELSSDYRILATRCEETSGNIIIMFVEHIKLPLIGSQFQPDRVIFKRDTSNSRICIEINQYLANTFVQFCRQNRNRFANTEQISRHLLYNWQPIFTGKYKEFRWMQAYFFEKNVDYPKDETKVVPCGCQE